MAIPYYDEYGRLLRTKYRLSLDERPKYKWENDGTGQYPYGLNHLATARELGYVWLVEGETDYAKLYEHGIPCLALPGADAWKPEYIAYLHDIGKVLLFQESDQGGNTFVCKITPDVPMALVAKAPQQAKDICELAKLGALSEKLRELSETAVLAQDPVGHEQCDRRATFEDFERGVNSLNSLISYSVSTLISWPSELEEAAFHGLAGDIVKAIEPHSEADRVAILLQFLTAFGSVIGRQAYFVAESDKHYPNIFVVLVGTTAKGRKGSSWGHVLRVIQPVNTDWASHRIETGLSSGEGLIWAVRDPIERSEPIREDKRVVGYQNVVIDQGEEDKRLLILEPEFASTLRVLNRDGNTLSAVIRTAWDSGELHTLTKNSQARATGAHISIIGHITKDEVCRYLDRTEMGNGFGNRFLWACVARSKVLPEGGNIGSVDFTSLERRLASAVRFAQNAGELKRDDQAREIWHRVYPDLSDGKPGLLGAMIARAEAQAMRLAMLYALLDQSRLIQVEHLQAALALWDYCEESAQFVFGQTLGGPMADEILKVLKSSATGLTRTDIMNHFNRNKTTNEISHALSSLREAGRAYAVPEKSGGRPIERWFALT